MDNLNVLITGVGAPGIRGTIYSLKNNYDNRNITIIGTDCKDGVIGKYLCDKFYKIPHAHEKKYLENLLAISEKEKIDVIIPQNTSELGLLSEEKVLFSSVSTKIIISDIKSIAIANNKYTLMKECITQNIPVGKFFLVNNKDELISKAKLLDWPKRKIVVKPPSSNGSRGVRIIDESIDLKKLFYNEKPTCLYIKMVDLEKLLGDTFPSLILTEFLPGYEYTVDVFQNGSTIVIPRKRQSIISGITFNGFLEKHRDIIAYSKKLSNSLKLKYCFGFQFKIDESGIPKIIECNPRVQGTMVMSTLAGANIIYSSVKAAINEEIPDFEIDWETKFFRFWGGISVNNSDRLIEI